MWSVTLLLLGRAILPFLFNGRRILFGFGFKFYGVVLASSSRLEIHVFPRLYQPYVCLYLLTFSSLDAFSKDTGSDSDLGGDTHWQ